MASPTHSAAFWRGFREGWWWTIRTFYPGLFLAMVVYVIHGWVA